MSKPFGTAREVTAMDRRCGTCNYWERLPTGIRGGTYSGECKIKRRATGKHMTFGRSKTGCKHWQPVCMSCFESKCLDDKCKLIDGQSKLDKGDVTAMDKRCETCFYDGIEISKTPCMECGNEIDYSRWQPKAEQDTQRCCDNLVLVDYKAADNCKNLESSFGEICVKCGKCGRKFGMAEILLPPRKKKQMCGTCGNNKEINPPMMPLRYDPCADCKDGSEYES